MVPAETDPEVSIGWAELCDELLYELLLRCRFHTQQLPSIPSAGKICLHEVKPPPELGEVGQLVTRPPFSCLADTLTCVHTYTHKCQLFNFFMCCLSYFKTIDLTVGILYTQVQIQLVVEASVLCVAYLWLRIYPLQEPNIQHRIGKAGQEETKDIHS